MPYYAVVSGRNPGIYSTWDECKRQIDNYPHAWYKKFKTRFEANKCMESCKQFKYLRSSYLSKSNNAFGPYMPEKSDEIHENNKTFSETEESVKTDLGLNEITEKMYNIRKKMGKLIVHFTEKIHVLNKRIDSVENEVISYRSGQAPYRLYNSKVGNSPRTLDEMCEAFTHHHPYEEHLSSVNKMNPAPAPLTLQPPPPPPPPPAQTWDHNPVPPLIQDKEGFIDVYIDGAVRKNGKGLTKGGIGVWFNHDHPLNIAAALEGAVTIMNAEVQAATRAIQQAAAAGLTKLNIHSDSMFMINCITKWVTSWKRNDWQTITGSPVRNKIELEKLDEAVKNMEAIKWTHIRSHQGNEGNESADILAHTGALMNNLKGPNKYYPLEFHNI